MTSQGPEEKFRFVKYLWRDEAANQLDEVDRLVYRSNKLGEDLTLTNTGGGNTSSKLIETDPLTGEPGEVLWVKGSGGDLRTAKRDGFASLYLDKVRAMKERYLSSPERGPKTPIEDVMYQMYSHCVFNLNPRACSIDTPLHTFVPFSTSTICTRTPSLRLPLPSIRKSGNTAVHSRASLSQSPVRCHGGGRREDAAVCEQS